MRSHVLPILASFMPMMLIAPAPAGAQADGFILPVGTLVRVGRSAPSDSTDRAIAWQTGRLYAVGRDTVWLVRGAHDRAPVGIPLQPDTRLEMGVGRRGQALAGAGIGLLTGGALGAVIGAAGGNDRPGFFSASASEKAAGGAIVLGLGGAVIGGVIGAFTRTERWMRVSAAGADRHLTLMPTGRGLAVSVAW